MANKIFKSWNVSFDYENKVAIKSQQDVQILEVIHEEEEAPDLGEDLLAQARDEQEKARLNARAVVDNATKEAGKILANARQEAERIKSEAEAEIDKQRAAVLLEAEKKGYDEGYSKGSGEALLIINEANDLKNETNNQREQAISRLEPELVELIIRIVKKLISENAKVNPQIVLHLIRMGLAQSSFTGDITLRVSQEDYDNVAANKEMLMKYVEGGANLEIIKDFSLNASDCLIETPFGVIDSSLDMQFEEIKQSLNLILSDARSDV